MKMFKIHSFGQSSHFTSAVNSGNGTASFLPPFFLSKNKEFTPCF